MHQLTASWPCVVAFLFLQANYLQRVNAELHELLEANDTEALQQQGQLEQERRSALQHCRQLQEVVAAMQARLEQGGQPGSRDVTSSADFTARLQVREEACCCAPSVQV